MNTKRLIPAALAVAFALSGLTAWAATTSPTPNPKRQLQKQCVTDRRIAEQDHRTAIQNAHQAYTAALEKARSDYKTALAKARADKSKDEAKAAQDALAAARKAAKDAWTTAKKAADDKFMVAKDAIKARCGNTTSASPSVTP